jgi:hypothetical protein
MKKMTLALTGLVAISSAAQASWSRWNGFGQANAFIADVQDIWTLPAVVASKKDTTYFEFGPAAGNPGSAASTAYNGLVAAGQAWGGAHGQLGPGVLAIWAGRPYSELGNLGGMSGAVGAPSFAGTNPTAAGALATIPSALTNQIDVLYGFDLSETVALGVGISRATSGTKTETKNSVAAATDGSVETSGSDLGVNLGADIKNVGPVALLEIGLQYNTRADLNTNKNEFTGTAGSNKNSSAGSDIDLRIGGDMTGEGGEFSRFEVQYAMDSIEFKSEADGFTPAATTYTSLKRGGSAWLLGYAMGKGNDKGMGLGGFTLGGTSTTNDAPYGGQNLNTGVALGFGAEKNSNSASTMALSFVSAGEMKAKDWLSLRAGLSTALFTSTSAVYERSTAGGAAAPTVKTTTTSSTAAPNAMVTTGASIHLGDVTIDGVLNQDVLYTWSHLVSGIAAAPFTQVSATWAWGGAKE